ncbi:MAG: histone deacetylase [Nitrospirae bacterium]|nr:MAG: histone deacetylase [Nitrospirota bacterium]
MAAVGWVYSERFLDHDTGDHPESPERLRAIARAVAAADLPLVRVRPRPATWAELERVHDRGYVAAVEDACLAGRSHLDPDTAICPDSFAVALLAAGAGIVAVERAFGDGPRRSFCCVRPPGHHAERARAMGFCLFNNVAVAAAHALEALGVARVAIVDWDVHHGNGTQHSFEAEPRVLYASLHQYPYYPGTGAASEGGRGPGAGTTVNCPLPAGSGDAAYRAAFETRILPALEAFRPQLILLSAGFDAHEADPLAAQRVTRDGFRWMGRRLVAAAEASAGGRLISFLEGGYNTAALGGLVVDHLETLAGEGEA